MALRCPSVGKAVFNLAVRWTSSSNGDNVENSVK